VTQSENGRTAPPELAAAPPETGGREPSAPPGALGPYIATVRREWPVIVLAVIVAGVFGYAARAAMSPGYEATAQVLVGQPQPVDALLGRPMPSADPERDLNTSVQLAGLESVATRVRRRLGLRDAPSALLGHVGIAPAGNSDIVSIVARDGDPSMAANIANAFAIEFRNARAESSRARVDEALSDARLRLRRLGPAVQDSRFGRDLAGEVERLQTLATFRTGDVEIVQRALPPALPSGLSAFKAGIIAAVLAALVAAGAIVLLTRTDHRLHEEDDVERAVGAPVLGSVPRGRGTAWPKTAASDRASRDAGGEAYLTLAARLSYRGLGTGPRVIVVTSVDDDGSAPVLALGVAKAFRTISRTVIAMEADMRAPRWAQEMKLKRSVGLATVLLGDGALESARLALPDRRCAAERASHDGRAWVVPAGRAVPRPEALLASNAMAALVEDASDQADFVLIAAPPMTLQGAALSITALCDGALLVVRASRTTDDAARRAGRRLQDVGIPLVGAVLTGVRRPPAGAPRANGLAGLRIRPWRPASGLGRMPAADDVHARPKGARR
jgi:capsular polysaccharide biosynthesis protein/Mrp family chromosome partitioning ATPase